MAIDMNKAMYVRDNIERELVAFRSMNDRDRFHGPSGATLDRWAGYLRFAKEALPETPEYQWPEPLTAAPNYLDAATFLTTLQGIVETAVPKTMPIGRISR